MLIGPKSKKWWIKCKANIGNELTKNHINYRYLILTVFVYGQSFWDIGCLNKMK